MREKVLLLFPMADRQTGPAIKYAFEKLGYIVEAVDAKRHPLLSYSVACGYKPDLVFCSRTKELTEQVAKIKRKFPNAVTCMWNVDTRYAINEWRHLYPLIQLCNYHFVVEYNFLTEWRKLNRNTFWLPQGLQNEIYDKPRRISDEDRRRYICDVCFCGGVEDVAGGDRTPFLEALAQADFKLNLWGDRGRPRIYNEEHNKQSALAKISICISRYPKNEKYISVRNYKILGAGGFALELYRKGIYNVFPPDTLACYRTPEQLVEKTYYWLSHEKERKEIAERGYTWVHANATYTHRIKMALEIMGL